MKPVIDNFSVDQNPGKVIGSAFDGVERKGADVEGLLSIGDGRLRIESQAKPGWGRAGVAYGPFDLRAGLAFSVQFLNGHNGAQDHPPRNLIRLIGRWLSGSETVAMASRMKAIFRHRDRESVRHRLHRFARLDRRAADGQQEVENAAAGWFTSPCPDAATGNGSVVVAGDPTHSGTLGVSFDGVPRTLRSQLGELPLTIFGVARERGSIFYSAVWPNDFGETGHELRPLGLTTAPLPDSVWVGLQQRRNSEIGFRADTLVESVAIADLPQWSQWWTTAHIADRFVGDDEQLIGSSPESAGEHEWTGAHGGLRRTDVGLQSSIPEAMADIDALNPAGLIHFRVRAGSTGGFSLRWRGDGNAGYWQLRADEHAWAIEIFEEGEAVSSWQGVAPRAASFDVLVVDDGMSVNVLANRKPVFAESIADGRYGQASQISIGSLGSGWRISEFEAHPRTLHLPPDLPDRLPAPFVLGTNEWTETFADLAGPLDGWTGAAGQWRRRLGEDRLVGGDVGVGVDVTVDAPSTGRTALTVPWVDPAAVDLCVDIVPPGTERGQGHRGRGGIVLWEDEANYVMVNTWLDDGFDGSSVSVFFNLDGYEDIFDAVWVNVGDHIAHGRRYRLGVSYREGELLIRVDETPVLYRQLVDIDPRARTLRVVEVGLLANWEWGTDTGTTFSNLTARRVENPSPTRSDAQSGG